MTQSTHSGARRLAQFCCVVVLVTLVFASTPALGQAETNDSSALVENVSYTGEGRADVAHGELFLWRSASHQFTVVVSSASAVDVEVCLVSNASGRTLGCEQASVPANATEPVAVDLVEWPANETGRQNVTAVLRAANASGPLDTQSVAVTVLRPDGDLDGDGLTDEREISLGTDPGSTDTDGDGLTDSIEGTTYETSPVAADTDGDGLSDGAEVERHLTNPTDADSDGDGLVDSEELAVGASPFNPDSDGDGITDAVEVNTYNTNATEADTDGDGLDDGAEVETYRTNPKDADTDGDELRDALEIYTFETDAGDPDTDDDGVGDGTEVDVYQTEPTLTDTDGDGLTDGEEVTTYDTNPLNADTDGDGLDDGTEVNRYETDPLSVDTDGDGTNDRFEVQTGILPGFLDLRLVVVTAMLTVAAATGGFYAAKGRAPGHHVLASLRARARGARRILGARPAGDGSTTASGAGSRDGRLSPDGSEESPPVPLSNEERVLRLLDDHEGQIPQSEIVEATSWSKSKVSRVLSKMEEDGQVVKIDVGRENVVTYPDEIPRGANPPSDR